ncbi:hypothetical protein [Nonomuraea sp. NPDC049784]
MLSTTLEKGADPRVTVHRDLGRLLHALAERGSTLTAARFPRLPART